MEKSLAAGSQIPKPSSDTQPEPCIQHIISGFLGNQAGKRWPGSFLQLPQPRGTKNPGDGFLDAGRMGSFRSSCIARWYLLKPEAGVNQTRMVDMNEYPGFADWSSVPHHAAGNIASQAEPLW